jgi:putative phosphoribosyl transferase
MESTIHAPFSRNVTVAYGQHWLPGILTIPAPAKGVVVFAHGSGSGRFSPRNQYVAGVLQRSEMATLLLDLLEEDEANDQRKVFDIPLLAERLDAAATWVKQQPELTPLKLGYFGASTGAGAALVAAVRSPRIVDAIVSRGGRPDLAGDRLPFVHAPTLLIVGGNDRVVLALNRQAALRLACEHRIVVVPEATHLFEEPGALEEVARLAAEWFSAHLRAKGNRC